VQLCVWRQREQGAWRTVLARRCFPAHAEEVFRAVAARYCTRSHIGLSSLPHDGLRNESVPIQLAVGTVPVLSAGHFNAKRSIYFSNKIQSSNFIKQHSETVIVRNYQNADCMQFNKNIYCVIYYNFRHTFVPYEDLCFLNCLFLVRPMQRQCFGR